MPTITLTADKDASAWANNDYWSGYDNHLPVGTNSNGNKWASFVHFNINMSGWTGITSATLKMTGAQVDFVTHNNGSSSTTLNIRRMTSDWGVGSNRGENSWGNETWGWNNRVDSGNTTSGDYNHTTGPQSSSWNNVVKNYDVTDIVKAWFSGSSNYGFLLKNTSTSSADGIEFYSRRSSGKEPELSITYTTNTSPTAPTLNSPIGGAITSNLTPTLSFTRNDVDSGDYISAYTCAVYSDAGGTTLVWSSGDVTVSGTSTTTAAVPVGVTLTGNTTYYWKARTRDKGSAWSPYSALGSFKANSAPPTPTGLSPANGSTVSTLTPTFSGVSDDADPGDDLDYANVVVYSDSGGTTVKSDSTDVVASGSTFSWTYTGGTALSPGTTYYWKCRTRDSNNAYSGWTALQSFTTYTVGQPTNMSPANAKVNTLTPAFTGTAAVTMNAYEYVIYQSDGTTAVYTSATIASSGTAVSFTYGGAPALSWGTKYNWKLRTRDTGNAWSAWSSLQPFWTNASPATTQTTPANNAITTVTPAFVSAYSDADKNNGFTDNPTNYTVEVSRVSDSVVMHTLSKSSGLSSTSNTVTRVAEGTALSLNVQYRWRARHTDSSGAANAVGSWTGYLTFKPSAAPTIGSFVVQAADLTSSQINKPNPTLTWTFTGSGGKAQTYKRLVIVRTSDAATVYDTGNVVSSTASIQVPVGILVNTVQYQFFLYAADTDGLEGTANVTYTVTWTPPDAPTSFSITADDINSRMMVTWDASTLAPTDFNRYDLYRKRLDSTESAFTMIASITNQATSEYDDYDAGVGATYEYYVVQWKNIAGASPLTSPDSEHIVTVLQADKWFITVPGISGMTVPLDVTDENHTAPFAEETFEPFGRNRKIVVRSGRYGNEGSIEAFFDQSVRIQYESILDQILELRQSVYLKSPFGDIFRVTLYAPQKKYLTGGHLQLSMNYVEVD